MKLIWGIFIGSLALVLLAGGGLQALQKASINERPMCMTHPEKASFGNPDLYEQIQQDALILIESYGFAVSRETAARGNPYIMNAMPTSGLTGPYSMSALACLAQAEALFGLTLGQLICPGIRAINSAMPTIADMSRKDMPMMFGSFGNAMLNILLAKLNMHFGIPCCQSACSHHRDTLDAKAEARCAEIYSLVNQYDFYILRHLFGFSSQLNDFNLDNKERQLALYREVSEHPRAVTLPEPAQYDAQGMDAIFEGLDRRDFRILNHTLTQIGRSFTH